MDTIRWGIIGVGNVCEVKSGPGFQKAANSELVVVMRRSGDQARDFAARHGVPKWTGDADAVIHDPDVNAIYIATPPGAHLPYTLKAAAAGKPVYVEKPMALNFAECQQMIGACRSAGVPLFVAYYRRALPKFLLIKDLLASGAIGTPRQVIVTHHKPDPPTLDPDNLPWRYRPERAGGGDFLDTGSHMLDILDFLLGPITTVHGLATNDQGRYPVENKVSAAFAFASGVQGVGSWCSGNDLREDRTEITGTRGRITYDCFGEQPVRLETAEGAQDLTYETPAHIQQPLIQTVVDDLRGEGTCPSTGESGARASWVMDRALEGYGAP